VKDARAQITFHNPAESPAAGTEARKSTGGRAAGAQASFDKIPLDATLNVPSDLNKRILTSLSNSGSVRRRVECYAIS